MPFLVWPAPGGTQLCPVYMRSLSLTALVMSVCLATSVFAQESTGDQTAPSTDQTAPSTTIDQGPTGPVLQPADYTPVICDPNAAGFRYLEVRGTGFDAFATQHLVGSVVDASGTPQIHWSNIWVSPQGQLTLEVNLCADPMQNRPALPVGDYTIAVGQGNGGAIAATGISLAPPSEPGAEDVPAGVVGTVAPTATPFTYVIPNVQAQPSPTPLPVGSLAAPTPTPGPRTGLGSLQQPYPQGAPGQLVDGWQMVVTGVTPDAYTGIKADVPSATAPASDQRDFMVRVQATYVAPGTGVFSGARLALLNTATQQTYDQVRNSCGVIPEAVVPSVSPQGATVRGNVCFMVRASDIGSLVAFDNQTSPADQVFFALQ